MKHKEGLRFNEGKTRIDLFPSDVLIHVSEILTKGSEKYEERNWEHGMPYSKILASLKRHLAKWESGADFDEESKLHHIDHVLCNAVFLSRHVHVFPEKDDRFLPYIMNHKRVGLDIDGVIADFVTPFLKRLNIKGKGNKSWYMSYKARDPKVWKELSKDKKFWLNIEPLIDPDSLIYEPQVYVTARDIPKEWTEEWLEKNGFPCNEVVVVSGNGGEHGCKSDELKSRSIDIFIDDHYNHFLSLNRSGVKCYLMDSYYNQRWNVGSLRIKHPNDVLNYYPA